MDIGIEKVVLVGGVLLVGGLLYFYYHQKSWADDYRRAAIADCQQADDSQRCLEGVEKRHDECFRKASVGGSRTSQGRVDTQKYNVCIRRGVDGMREWQREQAKKRREEEQRTGDYMP